MKLRAGRAYEAESTQGKDLEDEAGGTQSLDKGCCVSSLWIGEGGKGEGEGEGKPVSVCKEELFCITGPRFIFTLKHIYIFKS